MTLVNGSLKSRTGYVPAEVLSEIFVQCLDADAHGRISPSSLEAPLVLSWVCRFWRNVALNTHRLWTGIRFARKGDRIDDSTKLLKLWIARSGALPFDAKVSNIVGESECLFSVANRIQMDANTVRSMREFIDTLCSCSKRWRVLEVVVPEATFFAPLMRELPNARNLEDFGISSQYIGLYENPDYYDFCQNAKLRTLRLFTPLIRPLVPVERQTFLSLTMLELHFCSSLQDCLIWLDMAPNLMHLDLRLYGTIERNLPFTERRVRCLPFLTSIEILCFAGNPRFDDPGFLLDVLELPALEEIDFNFNYLFDTRPWTHLSDLLIRSGASLIGLSLHGTPMTDTEIVEVLRLSPNLQYLDCSTITDEILLALTPRLIAGSEDAPMSDSLGVQIHEDEQSSREEEESSIENMEIDKPAESLRPSNGAVQVSSESQTEAESAEEEGQEKELEDLSKYKVLCPNLQFFETDDVDVCSLQALYGMVSSRCEDVYADIRGYVDLSAIPQTPDAFRTMGSVILPCDPLYGVLSHPHILNSLERTIYF